MTGCRTCGGYGGHHDPTAHDIVIETPCSVGTHVLCASPYCECPCDQHADEELTQ